MIPRPPPFGTAMRDVLLTLTALRRGDSPWSVRSGETLYVTPALDEGICQGLAAWGYLSETYDGPVATFAVTEAGHRKASELRMQGLM